MSEWFGVLVYLVYGLSFFTLGVTAFFAVTRGETATPLTRALPFLGVFGVSHGALEWLTLFLRYHVTPPAYLPVALATSFLTAFSFTVLMQFGLVLLQRARGRLTWVYRTPWILFVAHATAGVLIARISDDVVAGLNALEQAGRLAIALPASVLVALGLIESEGRITTLEGPDAIRIAWRFRLLAAVFVVYGVLAGLIVDPVRFYERTRVPVELLRATAAFVALAIFLVVTEELRRRRTARLNALQLDRLIQAERDRLNRELHDRVIQVLFAAGLRLEQAAESACLLDESDELFAVRNSLNTTIREIRSFIAGARASSLRVADLVLAVSERCEVLRGAFAVEVDLTTSVEDPDLGVYEQSHAEDIDAILTESVSNAVRHGGARSIHVGLAVSRAQIDLTIRDNGPGFDSTTATTGLGLESMRTRTERAGGTLTVNSARKGTVVCASFPLAENDDA